MWKLRHFLVALDIELQNDFIVGKKHDFYNNGIFITGAIAKTSFYVEHALPHIIFNINCYGDEDSIYNCTYSSELPSGSRCYSGEDASVICQGKPSYTQSVLVALSLRVQYGVGHCSC